MWDKIIQLTSKISVFYIQKFSACGNLFHQSKTPICTGMLLQISDDELYNIFQFCDRSTIISLGACCKHLYNLSVSDFLWKPILNETEICIITKQNILREFKKQIAKYKKQQYCRIQYAKQLYERRKSRVGGFIPLLCFIGWLYCFLFGVAGSTTIFTVISSIQSNFIWISVIPLVVVSVLYIILTVFHAISARYLPLLDICRGISHEEFRLRKHEKMSEQGWWTLYRDKYRRNLWNWMTVSLTTSGMHYHFLWIIYIFIVTSIKILWYNSLTVRWMMLLLPSVVPMLLSVTMLLVGFLHNLKIQKTTEWDYYFPDEYLGGEIKVLMHMITLIFALMGYPCIFIGIYFIGAKLDGWFSVSWHGIFSPIYTFFGICMLIFCVSPFIIEALGCILKYKMLVTVVTGEVLRLLFAIIWICFFAPHVVFLILLGMKLEGSVINWGMVFLPEWIFVAFCIILMSFGLLCIGCCVSIPKGKQYYENL